ncbi:DUF3793 family protein [Alkalibaculum sporogenes]|nr:DUF3793 family protein [Alkalibaculum sporogenes]
MNKLSGKDYVKCIIAFGTAPTLRGKKPSSILTLKKQRKNVYYIWNRYKEEICSELGLDYYELVKRQDSVSVLFYRKESLELHLSDAKNKNYLENIGYEKNISFDNKLRLLRRRYSNICPHEMGIFLGIPAEDVCGFVKHQGKNCILCRYWKVYNNPIEAQKLFDNFDYARKIVIQEVIKEYNVA